MELDKGVKDVLENVDFLNRYKKVSKAFRFELKDSFKKYSNNEVLSIIEGQGHNASYEKKDNFFKVLEEEKGYQFQFNFILKSGIVEFIWSLNKEGHRIPMGGGTWGAIAESLGEHSPIRLPIFRNYNDLEAILSEAFSIYEDFKKEFLASQA